MPDARWDDPPEYGERARDDDRRRVYDERDRNDCDPSDALMHDVDEHPDVKIHRVILEQDLKREYQEFLQDHNGNRSDSGRPDRGEDEIREWAREQDLPSFDGLVHFPDYRIEYEVDGREHHWDGELFTPHYRDAHAASRSKTGFRMRASLQRWV